MFFGCVKKGIDVWVGGCQSYCKGVAKRGENGISGEKKRNSGKKNVDIKTCFNGNGTY